MREEEFKEYLSNRYLDQIKWYSIRASKNKNSYVFFQWGVIVLSAVIPVLIVVLNNLTWLTVLLSIFLAIGTAALKTFKFQENWMNYRMISETLKKEKYFYDADLDDYANAKDKKSVFVERVESLISKEHSFWITTHMKKEDTKLKQ